MMPVMPAKMKLNTPPIANSIAVVSQSLPRQRVASQANTLMPVGTAISMVVTMKTWRIHCGVPLVNMWCTHTIRLSSTMPKEAMATTW